MILPGQCCGSVPPLGRKWKSVSPSPHLSLHSAHVTQARAPAHSRQRLASGPCCLPGDLQGTGLALGPQCRQSGVEGGSPGPLPPHLLLSPPTLLRRPRGAACLLPEAGEPREHRHRSVCLTPLMPSSWGRVVEDTAGKTTISRTPPSGQPPRVTAGPSDPHGTFRDTLCSYGKMRL